jgi:hypothetical protein
LIKKEKNQDKLDKKIYSTIMNQTDNKLLPSLLKRLQELDQENKELKEKLTSQSSLKSNIDNSLSSQSYLKIKELLLANQNEEQICTLCDCELDKGKVVNLIKLYCCNNSNCSLLMERAIESVIDVLREQRK